LIRHDAGAMPAQTRSPEEEAAERAVKVSKFLS
jgi:hypothetical protein